MDKDSRDLKETATIAIASTLQQQYKMLENRYSELIEIYPEIEQDIHLKNRTNILRLSQLAICADKQLVNTMRELFIELNQVRQYRKPDMEFIEMIHSEILTQTEIIMQQLAYEKELIFNQGLTETIKNQHVVKHAFLRKKRDEKDTKNTREKTEQTSNENE